MHIFFRGRNGFKDTQNVKIYEYFHCRIFTVITISSNTICVRKVKKSILTFDMYNIHYSVISLYVRFNLSVIYSIYYYSDIYNINYLFSFIYLITFIIYTIIICQHSFIYNNIINKCDCNKYYRHAITKQLKIIINKNIYILKLMCIYFFVCINIKN